MAQSKNELPSKFANSTDLGITSELTWNLDIDSRLGREKRFKFMSQVPIATRDAEVVLAPGKQKKHMPLSICNLHNSDSAPGDTWLSGGIRSVCKIQFEEKQ